jgi:peptide chain release factor subunit 1
MYKCDSKFDTSLLKKSLESHETFGFIIIDGNGALFATLSGETKTILEKFSVDLPRKHCRGGQSKVRFDRIRLEKRHNYIREITECSVDHFIENDRPNITGLILAGSADIKYEVFKSDLLDIRLKPLILKTVDINYGGEIGLHEAITSSSEVLKNLKYINEKKIINSFFKEIALDSGKYVFGLKDTTQALLDGLIDTLIIFEDIKALRVLNQDGQSEFIADEKCRSEGDKIISIIDWLIEDNLYLKYVNKLELVTDHTSESILFVKGFSGIGGILKFKYEFIFSPDETCYGSELEDDFI